MDENLGKIYLTDCNLLLTQDLWQIHYKCQYRPDDKKLNTKIVSVVLNTQVL